MSDQLSSIDLATELTIAWLANPSTRSSADEVPVFFRRMHETLGALMGEAETEKAAVEMPSFTAAVSVRKSLASPDFIISMIDGKPYKTLRRHLNGHGLSPDQYRERYGLKADYPMTAPGYSEARREMARSLGLGRKPGQQSAAEPDEGSAPEAAQEHEAGGEQVTALVAE